MSRIILIILATLAVSATEALADVVIIIRRQAEASGNYVRICDIARVDGPKEQVAEVAAIILGPTPARGETREITRRDIEARLSEMGIAARVSLTGNDMVKVLGSGIRIPYPAEGGDVKLAEPAPFPAPGAAAAPGRTGTAVPEPGDGLEAKTRERLARTVSDYLAGQYRRPDIEINAKISSVSGAIPWDAREIKVVQATGRVPGRASLELSVQETPDAESRRITVAAETEIYGLALVAARQLPRGGTLARDDVKIARVRMESGKPYLPPRREAAAGRELLRQLKPGEAILANEAPPGQAVKRGDLVRGITSGYGWEIRSRGKALGGGMIGDIITVEDSVTKAKFEARITDRGVFFALANRNK
ncbi:MAG: flagellar basal body P-ring formation chaperone FlgA [Planctomycetota bacterium]|jgi:flagella basal body P-ring formation protein FlgA|nr:flagellar basal body P-ring formation chaperone FlgA [Planctomycetota bacterium]